MAKTTLDKLITMATKKSLSLIYEIENFANTYLRKVTKFQGNSLLCFGVLSHLLDWRSKTPPPPVLIGLRNVNLAASFCIKWYLLQWFTLSSLHVIRPAHFLIKFPLLFAYRTINCNKLLRNQSCKVKCCQYWERPSKEKHSDKSSRKVPHHNLMWFLKNLNNIPDTWQDIKEIHLRGRTSTKHGERASSYVDETPRGGFQLHLHGGVWPQNWKIDPSTD